MYGDTGDAQRFEIIITFTGHGHTITTELLLNHVTPNNNILAIVPDNIMIIQALI